MIPDYVKKEAQKELARRFFWDYCQYRYPDLYKDDRQFLKTLCDAVQSFSEQSDKKFLIVNLPPRHFKSLTATNLVEWLLGKDPTLKIMTGSYNETLSSTFARKVRDTIDEQPSKGVEVYNDLFPDTKVKYGQASKSLWAVEGSSQDSYLATSPTGTATGFGANFLIIDDVIKNAEEAYNRLKLEKDWEWLTNTMLSRTEGDWKVLVIMTRWATEDLAGKITNHYGDLVDVIQFKALQDDGSMLCEDVLSKRDYDIKTSGMSKEIAEANYNQSPIDVQGRLYDGFMVWDDMPEGVVENYTDTADTGADYLCSISYLESGGDVYIKDIVMTDAPMEITEPLVAKMLNETDTTKAVIEANNGGRGFRRNVERELQQLKNRKCILIDKTQTGNKEARILTSSAWVQKHVFMPKNWISKYPEFATQVLSYQKKGRNPHDDAVDCLAGIYDMVANNQVVDYGAWSIK